jgi:hypothetical protein
MLTTLNALKVGLYSHNDDLASWCCRLLAKIAYDFTTYDSEMGTEGKPQSMLEKGW